jgi:peptidoglycan/xylan/chitin deacetylase (PgdA/CDA1 family)
MLKRKLSLLIKWIDEIIGTISVLVGEKDGFISVLFHSLFRDKEEISRDLVDSQQRITLENFEESIRYFLSCGYQFVSPIDIENGLHKGKKIMITFDDGYYNNTLAVPILRKYKVPAVFFISINHVKEGKCFWWDVLYREGKKRGWSDNDSRKKGVRLKNKHYQEIEQNLKQTFGEKAFKPAGDVDRPLTPSELSKFSKEPYVHIGNHTLDHTILTLYSADEIRQQIMGAQSYLSEIVGYAPIIMAYPNGNYSDEVLREARKCGIKIGLSVDSHKDYLPVNLTYNNIMQLGRFVLWANKSIS